MLLTICLPIISFSDGFWRLANSIAQYKDGSDLVAKIRHRSLFTISHSREIALIPEACRWLRLGFSSLESVWIIFDA